VYCPPLLSTALGWPDAPVEGGVAAASYNQYL
jgi:hypothetical protein